MVGMKEKLGDGYDAWYRRHRLVENQRIWRIKMEENPMRLIPDFEREMPETYSLADMFYHSLGCKCGSCDGPMGRLVKKVHVEQFKKIPWIRGASSLVPELPHQIEDLLRSVEAIVLSPPDHE